MFKKLRDTVKVSKDFNAPTLLTGLAIVLSIFWVFDKHTDQVASNTTQIQSNKEILARIISDRKETAREVSRLAITVVDLTRLVEEIRAKVDSSP